MVHLYVHRILKKLSLSPPPHIMSSNISISKIEKLFLKTDQRERKRRERPSLSHVLDSQSLQLLLTRTIL
jgi:hypothetical protein